MARSHAGRIPRFDTIDEEILRQGSPKLKSRSPRNFKRGVPLHVDDRGANHRRRARTNGRFRLPRPYINLPCECWRINRIRRGWPPSPSPHSVANSAELSDLPPAGAGPVTSRPMSTLYATMHLRDCAALRPRALARGCWRFRLHLEHEGELQHRHVRDWMHSCSFKFIFSAVRTDARDRRTVGQWQRQQPIIQSQSKLIHLAAANMDSQSPVEYGHTRMNP